MQSTSPTIKSLLLALIKKIICLQVRKPQRKQRYILVIILVMLIIWGVALGVLFFKQPIYSSKMTLIMPGSGTSSSYNIDKIGQISSGHANPFSNPSISQNVVYKNIISSDLVIGMAAKKLNTEFDNLQNLKVKLTDQTSLIDIKMMGNNPKDAQQKLSAVYQAFSDMLNTLRLNEALSRQQSSQKSVQEHNQKLDEKRKLLLSYQVKSDIVSEKQFEKLSLLVEELDYQIILNDSKFKQKLGEKNALMHNLGLSIQKVADILTLQGDKIFQNAKDDYLSIRQTLRLNSSKWGEKHPEMQELQDILEKSYQAMQSRAKQLIKVGSNSLLDIMVDGTAKKTELFTQLLIIDTKLRGNASKQIELKTQAIKLKKKLNSHSKLAIKLEQLEKDYRVSEAIFTSYLTKLYSNKQDLFGSYPLVQVLSKPSLPSKPSFPKATIIIPAAIFGSLFFFTGLWVLWIRKPFIQKISQSE